MHQEQHTFHFEFSTGTVQCALKTNVYIPFTFSLDEQVYRMVKLNHLPSHIIPDLKEKLATFVEERTSDYERNHLPDISVYKNTSAVEALAKAIQDLHAKEVLAHAGSNQTSTEELCADIYGQVVASPALDAMLALEQAASAEVTTFVEQRDTELEELEARHSVDMDMAVSMRTPEQVNALAAQQFDDSQLTQSRWESQLLTLRENQREHFWNWLTGVHERVMLGDVDIPRRSLPAAGGPSDAPAPSPVHEESFTIHLGTQLKQMYNLRLLAVDTLQPYHYRGRIDEVDPRRIQTALDLYSSSLSGLVLLVDNRINSYTGLKKEFGRLACRATELHFPALDSQLEEIRNTVPEVVAWRAARAAQQRVDQAESSPAPVPPSQQLRSGDMYLTRHSNMANVHLVYHIVTDDSLRGDINSRHPVILALRNVLKVAFLSDVTTLSIPLLLSHEMSEEMTMAWCLRRVELVFKCVKGFMMEMVSWGGDETRTIHFVVPKNISEEVFSSVSALLPNIFRISNPLVVNSGAGEHPP